MTEPRQYFKDSEFANEQHKAFASILYLAVIAENHIEKTLQQFNLPINEYRTLRALRRLHPAGIGVYKLKDFLLDRNADISRLVDRLVNKGLVIRQPDELKKSTKNITLTAAGLEFIDEINKHRDKFNAPMMCLTDEEAKQLNQLLHKLQDSFNQSA